MSRLHDMKTKTEDEYIEQHWPELTEDEYEEKWFREAVE